MTSSKPYLLRALYQWITDNNFTPYLLAKTNIKGAVLPPQQLDNNQIVLNISPTATANFIISNEVVEFNARFSGIPKHIVLPMQAVLGIYAKENSVGMMFADIIEDGDSTDTENNMALAENKPRKSDGKNHNPNLKFIK